MEKTQIRSPEKAPSNEDSKVDHKKIHLLNPSEDAFFMQYVLYLASMKANIFKRLDYKVAAYLFKKFRRGDEIYLGIKLKEKMADELGCKSTSSIANSIKVLKDANYIESTGRRGYYIINVSLAFEKAEKCQVTITSSYY